VKTKQDNYSGIAVLTSFAALGVSIFALSISQKQYEHQIAEPNLIISGDTSDGYCDIRVDNRGGATATNVSVGISGYSTEDVEKIIVVPEQNYEIAVREYKSFLTFKSLGKRNQLRVILYSKNFKGGSIAVACGCIEGSAHQRNIHGPIPKIILD